nr:transposase [Streptomyces sp. NBC_00886]
MGEATAGVGRQYTGTTGQVSNAVVAVYCTYASLLGHCLIDGDLYVQNHWAQNPDQCERAGLGSDFIFLVRHPIRACRPVPPFRKPHRTGNG